MTFAAIATPELSLDLDAPLDKGIHLRLEKTDRRPARALGAIKRAIGAPEQIVGLDAVIRRYGDANADTKLRCHAIDHEGLGDGSGDPPRQIGGIIERIDVWA